MDLRSLALLASCLLLSGRCPAQPPALKLPSLVELQRQAAESVDITLGPSELSVVSQFMGEADARSAAVRKMVRGLQSVQVRNYRFDTDHVYARSDLEALRSQLAVSGWHQLVRVRGHGQDGDVDVYYALDNHTITAVAILAARPREFTLVNVVGAIDLDQIAALRRTFVPGERDGPPLTLATP